MCAAPILGWLAGRVSRWWLIAISGALWSLASGWSGWASSFAILLCTRAFVGIGEAGYGPAAPTILSDLYPIERRGGGFGLLFFSMAGGGGLGCTFLGRDFLPLYRRL